MKPLEQPNIQLFLKGKSYNLKDRPLVMGILNLTPDSFYSGSRFLDENLALKQVEKMVRFGADILDIGGESTRPGSQSISPQEEIQRVIPIIKSVQKHFPSLPISLDSYKPEVLQQGIEQGIDMINDVFALSFSPDMVRLAAQSNLPVILMHMQNNPKTMQHDPYYEDVVTEVALFLQNRIQHFLHHGGELKNVIIDPGIGFGKTLEHNFELLKNLEKLRINGVPILVGLSRKALFLKLLGLPVEERLTPSVVLGILSVLKGANILRVHDVKETVEAMALLRAMEI